MLSLSNKQELARAKSLALDAYCKWKIEQMLPLAKEWVDEGCDLAEIARRVDGFKDQVLKEAEGVLRCITIAALNDGASNG